MFKKKRTVFEQIVDGMKYANKKVQKWNKKIIGARIRNRKRYYRLITKGPAYLEIAINVLFIGAVLFLFYKKSKDPNFLSDFGSKKLN